ncbi:MAG: beta-lactamase family protein, partial [Hyphomonadaceae bacterium]|nr:beta-lactamase family protein [Hyphomonadaceae bacterium]
MRSIAFALPFSVLAPSTGWAQTTPAAPAAVSAQITDEALGHFADGVVHAYMAEHDLPGMQVAIVRDGRVALLRGYGYADIAQRTAMDPSTHTVRVASISKTFTWIAAMQLVERGQLDLDADVNTYLRGFQVPEAFGAPITMRHLMSHAAGFEERDLVDDFVVSEAANMQSVLEYLQDDPPARVRPPGEISAYSNYGSALAGHVVETIAGMPFASYVEVNILAPLRMQHSTFRQPLGADNPQSMTPELEAHGAQSYRSEGGQFRPTLFYLMPPAPAGALRSTAGDMSRYMLALLGDGSFEDGRILQQATLTRMREQTFTNAPQLTGWAHGFRERRIASVRTLEHGGSLDNFYSYMTLAPDLNVGVFATMSSQASRTPTFDFPERVLR